MIKKRIAKLDTRVSCLAVFFVRKMLSDTLNSDTITITLIL